VAIDGYGAQKRLEGERRQKNEQERLEAERSGGPTTGAQGTREARTTTVLVGRISRKDQSRQAISSLEIAGARVHRAEISPVFELLVQLFF
jgi:hypothetical protein